MSDLIERLNEHYEDCRTGARVRKAYETLCHERGIAAAEITRLQGEVAQLAERLRTMADVVAVYAMPPVEVVRQRDRFAQDQWNQISQICSELLEQALGADHDPA